MDEIISFITELLCCCFVCDDELEYSRYTDYRNNSDNSNCCGALFNNQIKRD